MSRYSATSTEGRRSRVVCLGIESTAHTFGASFAERVGEKDGGRILCDVKQVYSPPLGGGIHPREASRYHSENASLVVKRAFSEAGLTMRDVDAVAFSAGPGLGPCLRVGAVVARALSAFYGKPLVPVNHAVAHIELAMMLCGVMDPVVLLVSGGHTLITAFTAGRWRIFGETLDITAGQLIDQFGREAGFSSPCGARVEECASRSSSYTPLPYTVKGNDVSLSGVLTAAKRLLHQGSRLEDLCYSLQETAFAMLAEVTERALAFTEKTEVLLVGGVAANRRLQAMLLELAERHHAAFHVVPLSYSGDCGAQIAWNGLIAYEAGVSVDVERSVIRQSWRLDRVDAKWRS